MDTDQVIKLLYELQIMKDTFEDEEAKYVAAQFYQHIIRTTILPQMENPRKNVSIMTKADLCHRFMNLPEHLRIYILGVAGKLWPQVAITSNSGLCKLLGGLDQEKSQDVLEKLHLEICQAEVAAAASKKEEI